MYSHNNVPFHWTQQFICICRALCSHYVVSTLSTLHECSFSSFFLALDRSHLCLHIYWMCSYWIHVNGAARTQYRAIRRMFGRECVCSFFHPHSYPTPYNVFLCRSRQKFPPMFTFLHFGCLEAYEVDRCQVWNSFSTMAGKSAQSTKFPRSRICLPFVLDVVSAAVITTQPNWLRT